MPQNIFRGKTVSSASGSEKTRHPQVDERKLDTYISAFTKLLQKGSKALLKNLTMLYKNTGGGNPCIDIGKEHSKKDSTNLGNNSKN